MTDSPAEEQPSRTDISAELARLGEAYFVTQHTYDPYNATLLGLDEFDGLSTDPSREAGTRAAHELAAIGRQVSEIDTTGLTVPTPSTRCGPPTRRRKATSAGRA